MKIVKNLLTENQKRKLPEDISKLGFGKIFTDHMFITNYENGQWQNPEIKPFQNLSLSPAALVLHYGQEIFEGMKAFKQVNGKDVSLFRPKKNAERMVTSAERMSMQPYPVEDFLVALDELIKIDKHWVPSANETSLYIRPTMIASESVLGLKTSEKYLFYIILSPVGPYFKEGFKPIKIFVEPEYIRAVKGGIGEAKTGGNYAASLLALKKAFNAGCSQVLWLDAIHHKYVEESGTMNQFFVIDNVIYTASLEGTILKGVTRESAIHLAIDQGFTVKEEPITIEQILDGIKKNKLTEAFGSGTAASIAPVGELYYKDEKFTINDFKVGPITKLLYDKLTGIQYGRIADPYGWNIKIQ